MQGENLYLREQAENEDFGRRVKKRKEYAEIKGKYHKKYKTYYME